MIQANALVLNSYLATERLVLEPLTAAHAEKLFAPLQDENIYTWISATAPQSVHALQVKWERLESRLSTDGSEAWLNWAVRRKSDGHYVGKIDAAIDAAEIATNLGYLFFPPYWKNGYAFEAIDAVVNHFSRHRVKQIRATVTVGNEASARLLEKTGFVRVRVIPDNDVVRGVKVDDIEYIRVFR